MSDHDISVKQSKQTNKSIIELSNSNQKLEKNIEIVIVTEDPTLPRAWIEEPLPVIPQKMDNEQNNNEVFRLFQ